MTLAEQYFKHEELEMQIFNEVNKILGCDTGGCSDPDFQWGCYDVAFDSYDNSIEVMRSDGAQFMSREQADRILDLGFSAVFETRGESAVCWTKGGHYKCSPSEPSEVHRFRAQIDALRKELQKEQGG